MRSRTFCINGPVLRKNFSRFAPAWLLYTVCLLLGLLLMTDSGTEYWLSANIAQSIGFMGMVNFAYGALIALLIFGDLTNSRLCNGLHALPLRRETWFCTHILSGLLFSILPTTVMTAGAVVLSNYSAMENGWQIPLYWMLGTNLEYVFFFGLAVFCMMLSGNRVGAAVIYCILNFGAFLTFYVAEIVYVPHLPGVVAQIDPFLPFCPVVMLSTLDPVHTEQVKDFQSYASDGSENYLLRGTFTRSDEWQYLWIIAALGAVLILLALLLYRRRKLECAGDLLAAKPLEFPFLALFSLVASGCLQLFYVAFLGYEAYGTTPFLWPGLVIGWFAGLMLLRRSARVFQFRNFLGLALVAAGLGLSLLVNSLDPFGITTWTPKAEDVKSTKLDLSYMSSITLEEQEDIADVIRLHEQASDAQLEGELGAVNRPVELAEGDGTLIGITYEMKDGSTHAREYFILIDSEAGSIVRKHFSTLDAIFSGYYYSPLLREQMQTPEGLLSMLDTPTGISISGTGLAREHLTEENAEALLRAIIADSEAGNLVQHSAFHPEAVLVDEEHAIRCWSYSLYIDFPEDHIYLDIFADSTHTLAWLEEKGLTEQFHEDLKADSRG